MPKYGWIMSDKQGEANDVPLVNSATVTNHGSSDTPKGGKAPDGKGAGGASESAPTQLDTSAKRFAKILEQEIRQLLERIKEISHKSESQYNNEAKSELQQTLKAIKTAYRLAEMRGTSETLAKLRKKITNLGLQFEECLDPLSKSKKWESRLDGAIVGGIAVAAVLITAWGLMPKSQKLAPVVPAHSAADLEEVATAAATKAVALKGQPPDAPGEKRDKARLPEKLPDGGAPLGKGDRQMSPGPDPKAVEAAGQLAGQVKELKDYLTAAKLNELPKRIAEAQPPAKPAVQDRPPDNPHDLRDVMIVALSSPNLSAKEYVRVYEHVLSRFARGKDARPRVGLVVAQTAEANLWVKLTDEKVNLSALGAPAPNATESPDRFGETLKGFFDPLRPARRAVLVASIDCPPLLPDTGGWRDLEVHVVLVARRELTPEDRDRLLQWHHVDARGGSVRLVPGPGSTVPLDRQLQDRVLDLCKMKVD